MSLQQVLQMIDGVSSCILIGCFLKLWMDFHKEIGTPIVAPRGLHLFNFQMIKEWRGKYGPINTQSSVHHHYYWCYSSIRKASHFKQDEEICYASLQELSL